MTSSVWTQTSPSGCHSGSCGQPTSASSSGNSRSTTAELEREREPDRRPPRAQQQLLDLSPDPLGRQIVERNGPAERRRRRRRRANSNRAANWTARSTRRLSSPNVGGSTARSSRRSRSPRPSNGSSYSPVSGSQAMALIGEVAPPRGLSQRQRRIARHREAAMPAAGLRLAPRQRHVEAGHLVDGEALADGVDAAEAPAGSSFSAIGVDAEDLDVDVLRGVTHQPIAHPAADDQRAAAGVAHARARSPSRRVDARRRPSRHSRTVRKP